MHFKYWKLGWFLIYSLVSLIVKVVPYMESCCPLHGKLVSLIWKVGVPYMEIWCPLYGKLVSLIWKVGVPYRESCPL